MNTAGALNLFAEILNDAVRDIQQSADTQALTCVLVQTDQDTDDGFLSRVLSEQATIRSDQQAQIIQQATSLSCQAWMV